MKNTEPTTNLVSYTQSRTRPVTEFMDEIGAPYIEWSGNLSKYESLWSHYTGESLEVTSKKDKRVMLFPLRDNLFAKFVDLHSALLWGAETEGALVAFYTDSILSDSEGVDQTPSDVISAVLIESGGYEKLREAARMFNTFGSVLIGITPNDYNVSKGEITVVSPQSAIPVFGPDGELDELWIVMWIAGSTARRMGWTGKNDDQVIYAEHWTKDSWEIVLGVGGRKITAVDGDGEELAGPNVYKSKNGRKMIPYKFVKRLPIGNDGQSLITPIVGLVEELNARSSDMGLAIMESSHQKTWVRNYDGKKNLNLNDYTDGRVIPLGNAVGDMSQPEMGVIQPAPQPESHMKFIEWLEDQVRQSTHTAAVILGLDEGSQRSGETMTARALPTIAIINDYRDSWANAFLYLAKVAIIIYNLRAGKEVDDNAIVRTNYNPILSRDREVIANIEAVLKGAGLRSTKTSVQKLGDVRDVDTEVKEIEKERKESAEFGATTNTLATGNSGPKAELPVRDKG